MSRMHQCTTGFCAPIAVALVPHGRPHSPIRVSRNFRAFTTLRRARSARLKMVAPQPDDTAVDMITFALSGPGISTFGIFLAVSAVIILTNFEIFPKRRDAPMENPFFMRILLDKPMTLEFPDGAVRSLSEGESIFRFPSREACEAVARNVQRVPSRYVIYRLDGLSVKTLSTWPYEVNVSKQAWPDTAIREQTADDSSSARMWDDYERIGAVDKLDKQWSAFMQQMASPVFSDEETAPCKLCGGTGFTRCFRCGGASPVEGSTFTCDCQQGRRPCEWCAQ